MLMQLGIVRWDPVVCLLEFNVSLSQVTDISRPCQEINFCPDQDSIPVSQDTMIDEQSQRVDYALGIVQWDPVDE